MVGRAVEPVGDAEGRAVGAFVLRCCVGEEVGCEEGLYVGFVEGLNEGIADGLNVGCVDGLCVGDEVVAGMAVG